MRGLRLATRPAEMARGSLLNALDQGRATPIGLLRLRRRADGDAGDLRSRPTELDPEAPDFIVPILTPECAYCSEIAEVLAGQQHADDIKTSDGICISRYLRA